MPPSKPDVTCKDARYDPGAHVVPDEVLSAYNLNVDTTVELLDTDSFNIHFRLNIDEEAFDLRRSNRPGDSDNLLFEAGLVAHLRTNSSDLGPETIPARDGRPNIWYQGTGWTLFKWLSDGPKIVRMDMSDARREHTAQVLGWLHSVTSDFCPSGVRGDLPIFARPEDWSKRWFRRVELLVETQGPEADTLLDYARQIPNEMNDIDFTSLPHCVCHADYRPANIRFEDDRVAVVFDSDTAFQTVRILDLSGVVTRFSLIGRGSLAVTNSASHFLHSFDAASPLPHQSGMPFPRSFAGDLYRV